MRSQNSALVSRSGSGGTNEETPLVASLHEKNEHIDTLQSTEFITADTLERARKLLYLSHFFAQFSENAWQFALILFLAAFTNYESLTLVSSYGLTSGLAVCLFGTMAGRFVDSRNRLSAARFFIWTENLCVVIASFLCYILLLSSNDATRIPKDPVSISLLVGIHIFGPIAQILDRGFLVAIERDWVVVMGKASAENTLNRNALGESRKVENWLTQTNVIMKQIDLSCKVVAPSVAGFAVDAFGKGKNLSRAAVLIGLLNVSSLVVEYICTKLIYDLVPQLSQKTDKKLEDIQSSQDGDHRSSVKIEAEQKSKTCDPIKLPRGLEIYLAQPIFAAGLGLAMLYLNALTFGGLMTAYLVWRGMRMSTVGVWRGVSSAAGLAGTFVYHASTRRLTLVSTGMWSIVYQLACISLSLASLFVKKFELSVAMLIAGVCASRIGLWVFDISVTQLMQEFIPDGIRGSVGGTQHSLNALFQLSSFALGLVFPNPKDFIVVVAAGYVAVGFAVTFYFFGIFRKAEQFSATSQEI